MANQLTQTQDNTLIQNIDVLEESIRSMDTKLLEILLSDNTTHKNIIWATSDYTELGIGFEEQAEISVAHITGRWATLIQPRITKEIETQTVRTRDKAEVFTPSWICNKQNNLIDEQWFQRKDVFNHETDETWIPVTEPISFAGARKDWKHYVDAQRLEVSCGEAPYLVSRYDTVTGEKIDLWNRIGLLDRKMRIVRENTTTEEEWLHWSQRAFESVYGYEYQGDNLLLARENLLYSYIDYFHERFGYVPSNKHLRKIALIVSWNIWQMDGLRYVVPKSCVPEPQLEQMSMFDVFGEETANESLVPCKGCTTGNIHAHTGIYCVMKDWRSKCKVPFISMMKGV